MSLATQVTNPYYDGMSLTGAILQSEFSGIITKLNSIDNDNVATAAGIVMTKTELGAAARSTNHIGLQNTKRVYFQKSTNSDDHSIYEDAAASNLNIDLGTAAKSLIVHRSSGASVFQVDTNNARVSLLNGYYLSVFDSAETDYLKLSHDGSNALYDVNAGGHIFRDTTSANRLVIDGTTTTLTSHLRVGTGNTYDIGASGTPFQNGYFNNTVYATTFSGSVIGAGSNVDCNGEFRPLTDNTWTNGNGSRRWTAVYATNGTIQTSFSWEKKNIEVLDGKYCLDQLPPAVQFDWLDDKGGRYIGIIADNLPPYALEFESNSATPVGVRQSAVVGLLAGAVKELETQIKTLRAQVLAQ